jgi:hypothetical protein
MIKKTELRKEHESTFKDKQGLAFVVCIDTF